MPSAARTPKTAIANASTTPESKRAQLLVLTRCLRIRPIATAWAGRNPAEAYQTAGLGGFMRLRLTVLACALTACAFTAIPGVAAAAPQHNRGLSIHAVPHQIVAGEAVLIYGQLKGPDHGNQLIRLYHRINPAPFFSLIG